MSTVPIRIVLVETSHPGNIGGVARAMKNMSLERLTLVTPRLFPHSDATARASGADDILAGATLCDSLQQALEGCSLVFGASARRRTISWPLVDARECGRMAVAGGTVGEVAVVFGREHSGLTNEELEQCNYLVHIPSNPVYSSLNIAAAVQVIAYEIMMAAGGGAMEPAPKRSENELPATADDIERFYVHLEESLVQIGFLDRDNPRQLMRRLRRLYNRAGLSRNELNILRGILTAVDKEVKR
jgi:tRNA (cytidine32/uridine32-2'-O)-methyltransferase